MRQACPIPILPAPRDPTVTFPRYVLRLASPRVHAQPYLRALPLHRVFFCHNRSALSTSFLTVALPPNQHHPSSQILDPPIAPRLACVICKNAERFLAVPSSAKTKPQRCWSANRSGQQCLSGYLYKDRHPPVLHVAYSTYSTYSTLLK